MPERDLFRRVRHLLRGANDATCEPPGSTRPREQTHDSKGTDCDQQPLQAADLLRQRTPYKHLLCIRAAHDDFQMRAVSSR